MEYMEEILKEKLYETKNDPKIANMILSYLDKCKFCHKYKDDILLYYVKQKKKYKIYKFLFDVKYEEMCVNCFRSRDDVMNPEDFNKEYWYNNERCYM